MTQDYPENGTKPEIDFREIADQKTLQILPLLNGLTMSQIENVLKQVGNAAYCHPIRIEISLNQL